MSKEKDPAEKPIPPVSSSVTRKLSQSKGIQLYGQLEEPFRRRTNSVSNSKRKVSSTSDSLLDGPGPQRRRSGSLNPVAEDSVFVSDTCVTVESPAWDSYSHPSPRFTLGYQPTDSTSTYFDVSVVRTENLDILSDEDDFHDTETADGAEPDGDVNPIENIEIFEMDEVKLLRSHRTEIHRAAMIVEDDITGVDIAKIPLEIVEQKLKLATEHKVKVQEAILYLMEMDTERFETRLKTTALTAKQQLIEFIRTAQEFIKVQKDELRATAATARTERSQIADTVIRIKQDKVKEFEPKVTDGIQKLIDEMELLSVTIPEDDSTFHALNDKFSVLNKRSETMIKDAQTLCSEAMETGLELPARSLGRMVSSLKETRMELEDKLLEYKDKFGIRGATQGIGKYADVEPPKFRGDGDKIDFFTFKREWTDYISTKPYTNASRLRVLLHTCLQGNAKEACLHYKTEEEVWEHLAKSYGNPTILINNKVEEIRKLGPCTGSSIKKREWAIAVSTKLHYTAELATTFKKIEDLYYSPIIPEIVRGFPTKTHEEFEEALREHEDEYGVVSKQQIFETLITFIDKLLKDTTSRINYELSMSKGPEKEKEKARTGEPEKKQQNRKTYTNEKTDKPPNKKKKVLANVQNSSVSSKPKPVDCTLCSGTHTHLFYCAQFTNKLVKDRYSLVAGINVCFRCLRMDSNVDFNNRATWFEKHKDDCVTDFSCSVSTCVGKPVNKQVHMLMCRWHIRTNKTLEQDFIKSTVQSEFPPGDVKLFYVNGMYPVRSAAKPNPAKQVSGFEIIPDVEEPSIFLLQNIAVDKDRDLFMFYDSGCGGASISDRAYSLLDTETVRPGPTFLNVAGGETIRLEHGDERFWLELDGLKAKATVTGIRMPHITTPFPLLDLNEAWEDLNQEYLKVHPKGAPLPRVDRSIGGVEVDIMLGIRYNRYFPTLLFSLPTGLGIYKSQFVSARNCLGILGGPHRAWRTAVDSAHHIGSSAYITQEMRAYYIQSNCLSNTPYLLSSPEDGEKFQEDDLNEDEEPGTVRCEYLHCSKHKEDANWIIPINWNLEKTIYTVTQDGRKFRETENLGTEVEYRCVSCRNCSRCRQGDILEKVSLQEEVEQSMIENSVKLNIERKVLEANLPFIQDPSTHLKPNRYIAEKILESQMKLALKSPEIKYDIVQAHNKLLSKGHVSKVTDLTPDERSRMENAGGAGYTIPWRVVHKEGSLSTPCRLVFDASSATSTGNSLNSILAKGQNKLSRLLNLLIRFRSKEYAVTGDISMAYNGVKLRPEDYRFQRYLWREDLDQGNPVEEMVVKTLIYGVRSSGNQTIAGFNKLADYCIDRYPEHADGADVLKNEAYMDDVMDSEDSMEQCQKVAADITFTLGLGSMGVKAFTYSGAKPEETVSADGERVGVVGYHWKPKEDTLSLDIKDLYLGKVRRGKRPELITGNIGDALKLRFTKRIVSGKVMAVYDPLGLATPVTARYKLDLHELTRLQLDWDDPIPLEHLDTWVDNLESMQQLKNVYFRRTFIPPNAANTDIELITSVDASENLAVAAVHSRILLRDGSYYTQLITAKSKLVNTATIPRAELKGAVTGAVLAHVVKQNLGERYKGCIYVTDSSICLYWINQDERPLQVTIRNSVIEIRRFTSPQQWFHIESELNLADLGTRDASTAEIAEGSDWQLGKEWMREPRESMPIKSAEQLTLSSEEKRVAASELKAPDIRGHVLLNLTSKVGDRYSFSKYIIDPCLLSWPKSVRVLACVNRFIAKLKERVQAVPRVKLKQTKRGALQFSQEEIEAAEKYFFQLGTKEVKQFSKEKDWKQCSEYKDGVLLYTGRILDGQDIHDVEQIMSDLQPLSFVKPVLDRYSPISYAIMIYCHQSVSRHKNAIATMRESRNFAYIIGARDLANEIRESCVYCRRFRRRLLEVEMGNIHQTRLTIAPVFFNSQVDLMGPFVAICEHNHRSSVKVWGLVFKDPATSAIWVTTMAKYDTPSFLMAYTRFTSRFGHPAKLYVDEGSQLVKGCKEMQFNWIDVASSLNASYGTGIDYSTCPVGGHNAHGQVERSILEVKRLFYNVYSGLKLDILSYETAFAWISNELNNLPICLGSKYVNLEHADLITPSRLMLGRNNRRSPTGFVRIDTKSRLLEQMQKVERAWWETWKTEKLLEYIPQPQRWRKGGYEPKPDDIVIFTKEEKDRVLGEPVWRTGRISETVRSGDGKVRSVVIQYKNPNESVYRNTHRSVRKIAVLHKEGELELVEELNLAAKQANVSFLLHKPGKNSNPTPKLIDNRELRLQPEAPGQVVETGVVNTTDYCDEADETSPTFQGRSEASDIEPNLQDQEERNLQDQQE